MHTKIIEATNGPRNWGKFLLARADWEWGQTSAVADVPLLRACSRAMDELWVMDLQTGEGACFRPGGHAHNDLKKHKIWVCPLYEPFLTWLYTQDTTDLGALPDHIDLPDAPFAFAGYRRPGPGAGAPVDTPPPPSV